MNRGRGAVLAGVAALAVVAGTVLGQAGQGGGAPPGLASAESAGPRGLAAARELLAARGVAVVRRGPGDPLLPGAGTVLLAAPGAPIPAAEVKALIEEAAGGATVLVALGPAPQPALLDALGLALAPSLEPRTARGLAPHRLLGDLSLPGRAASLEVLRPGPLPVSGAPGWGSAVSAPAGRGEVLVLSGPEPLENGHLLEGDAVSLIVRLGALGPVVIDERFLSAESPQPPPTRHALALLGAQLLLAGLTLALALGRRLGAVRPPAPAEVGQTTRDYLTSLAALYRRAGAEAELAALAWAALRRRLERRAGIPARLSDADAARRLPAGDPARALALARGAAALAGGGAGVLLRVTRAAADAEALLGAGGHGPRRHREPAPGRPPR
ncbi:MAG TPA: DUF4350 domain-containing protein [Anaeromyxobacter sp.]|nr:DUF4350 domain-containing protein [Anaeromyxobacter sp.]